MAEPEEAQSTPTWQQRAEALTHILTQPSHAPSLHSQLFVASRVRCTPPTSPYSPFLCAAPSSGPTLLRWALSAVYLPRLSRLGLPPSSWRSRCPFQLPPPVVRSAAIEPPPERWGEAELQEYARRRRAQRGRMRARPRPSVAVPEWVLVAAPNLAILAVLVCDPFFWIRRRN